MVKSVLGIVGGSGLYSLPHLENPTWKKVASPWGEPSDEILFAEIDGLPVRFLPRHGRGHAHSPTGINYRAKIDVLKRSGVTDLFSVSACGSLREDLPPGKFVLVDQFIDRTFAREKSFFDNGLVAHVSVADPVSPALVDEVEKALKAAQVDIAAVLAVMKTNTEHAQAALTRLIANFPREHVPCPIGSDRALDVALITAHDVRNPALLAKLDAVAGRVLKA